MPLFPLSREEIARRLARPAPRPTAEDRHLFGLPSGAQATEAAVMLPLVHREGEVNVLFTQRTAHLADHAGQISFPGGRVEPEDVSREVTALRETEEEIGLPRDRIDVLARLPLYEVPSGFRITPVVGWIEAPFTLQLDAFEVAEVFEVPVEHFLRLENYVRRDYHFRGRHRHYLAVPYEGRYIWGATAGMLYSFCSALLAEGR
ncbi:MAG TPA: CoA pyrophosphatase [Burkholderiales bacterium]|nr:CoA pyrophosphatase [Burkholderiales bacterium]